MARAGKWDDALNQWVGVTMKKNASDRIFNMAVANEMLAYAKYRSTQDMPRCPDLPHQPDSQTRTRPQRPNRRATTEMSDPNVNIGAGQT